MPAQRGVRHVVGEVAHPFQVGAHVQGGQYHPQVGRDRRLAGHHVVHLVLDDAVQRVDLGVAVDDLLGCRAVGAQQPGGGPAQGGPYRLGHRHEGVTDLGQFGPELVAHSDTIGWTR